MRTELDLTRSMPRRYVTRARRQPQNRALVAVGAVVGALALLLILPTVAFGYVYQGRVNPGVRVLNRDIGGMTHAEARVVLQSAQAQELVRPVKIQGREAAQSAPLADLGVTVDLEQTIENARMIGRDRDPISNLVAQTVASTVGWNVKPVFTVDEKQRQAVVNYFQATNDQPLVDARLSLDVENRLVITPSQVGRKLDVGNLTQQIEQVAAGQRDANIALKVDETKPFVNEADLEAMRASAERILSSPIRLTYNKENWTLGRKELAEMLTLPAGRKGTSEQLTINPQLLTDYVQKLSGQINRPPRDAKFGFSRGDVTVKQESQDGLEVDVKSTVAAIVSAVGTDQRDISLAVKVERPKIDSSERDKIAIVERLKSGTSNYGGGISERLHNVELATERLDGILIAPGETFSFNKALGPATIENGFKWGFGIASNGAGGFSTVPSEAGGICQVATTLFQAAFRAGLEIEERNPHLYWIPRYAWSDSGMIGLDATVDDPSTDFKFRNNTGNWLGISSRVDKARTTIAFDIYGVDPGWKVKIDGPVITDKQLADQKTVYQESDDLPYGELWVEHAEDGFTATLTRTVQDGSGKTILGPSVFRSVYQPSHNVLMVRKGTAAARQSAATVATPSTTTSAAAGGARISPAQATAASVASPVPAITGAGTGSAGTTNGATAGTGSTGTGGTAGGAVQATPAPPSNRAAQPPALNPTVVAPAAPAAPAPVQPTKAPVAPAPAAAPAPSSPNGLGGSGSVGGGGNALPPPIATPRASGVTPPLIPEQKPPAAPAANPPRPAAQFAPAGR